MFLFWYNKEMEKDSEIKIQEIGSFFETDKDGYIINSASKNKIAEKYWPVLNDIVELYKQEFGEKLISVYLRGSVAKGTAIDGIADIDTFALVNDNDINLKRDWKLLKKEIYKKYPQYDDIEMGATPSFDIERGFEILLHQSVAIYGNEITVPQKKIDSQFAMHAPRLDRRLEKFDSWIKTGNFDKRRCTWFMKTLLRTGLELTLDKAQKYSRDLYPCYQLFSEYYPEKELDMKKVLYLALNPIDDVEKLNKIRNNFGEWLLHECKKQEWKMYE